jgi:hypothetical protein
MTREAEHACTFTPEPANPSALRHCGARALALRWIVAPVVLFGAAGATLTLGDPFAISAIASTAAIVLHNPRRFRERPHRILCCYVAGFAISVPISLGGAWVGIPAMLAAAASAVLIVASRLGSLHPPTACIPLAITTPLVPPAALVGRWASFAAVAFVCLVVLWCSCIGMRTQANIRKEVDTR